jgi:hypothetical protein
MICPFCQDIVSNFDPPSDGGLGLHCPVCHADDVPRLYPLDYAAHPAVPVCIFGPTGHGKSVYIDALLTHLETRVRWPGFSCQWMDQDGMRASRERLRQLREFGALPDATNEVFPRPQVIRLRGIPRVGGVQLLFYDTGGETFKDVSKLADAGRYLHRAGAVVWLISLRELEYREQLSDLMTVYAQAMVFMGGDPKSQTVIVALTKGDLLLRDDESLPLSAKDFLENDDLDPAGNAWSRLARVSSELRAWLCRGEHANVVNLLEAQFKSARFCILSATGSAPDEENRLAFEPMPRGVLAPLFWLWHETLPLAILETGRARIPFFTLQQAVEAAPTGSTIHLQPHTYTLARRLEIARPLRIIGKDQRATVIQCAQERFVVGIGAASGEVHLTGLSLQHTGSEPADVVRVLSGTVALEKCEVTGGIGSGATIPGDCVLVMRDANAKLAACVLQKNQGNGLSIRDQAKCSMRQSQLVVNGQSGLHASGISVEIHACTLSENKGKGAHVEGTTRCILTNNVLAKNGINGLAAFGNSILELSGNKFDDNAMDGIVCWNQVVVAAERNGSSRNKRSGVAMHDDVA